MYGNLIILLGVAIDAGREDTSMVILGTYEKSVILADATASSSHLFTVSDKIFDITYDTDSGL